MILDAAEEIRSARDQALATIVNLGKVNALAIVSSVTLTVTIDPQGTG